MGLKTLLGHLNAIFEKMNLENIPEDQIDSLLEAVEALGKKSPLDYVPHPPNPKTGFGGMKLFHTSPSRVRLILGGNQSGKTVSGANELLFHATGLYPEWYPQEKRINHPIKARIVGEDYTKWGKVLEDKIMEWLPTELVVRVGRTLKRALESIEIRHISGGVSYIDVMTHEQDDGVFESWTGDFAWFDEPPPYSKYIATMRGLMAQGGRCIFTMTLVKEPWIYDRFIIDKDKEEELNDIYNRSDYIYVDITDNIHLKQKDIDWYASQLTEDERDARLHGRPKHLAGRVHKEFDEAVHVIPKTCVKVGDNWPVYFVLDPHDRKPHYGIWARISPLGTIYIVDEIKFKGTIKDFSKEVRVREARQKIKSDDVIRIGDPNKMKTPSAMNGRTFQQEFAGEDNPYKLYFNCDVNDDITLGHIAIAGKLMWNKSKDLSSTNCPKIYWFKETTRECVKEMLTYVWNDYKGAAADSHGIRETPKDINKDFPDCVRYLVMSNPYWIDPREEHDPVQVRITGFTGYGR